MTDAELIAEFIAAHGVTVCPVGTFAQPEPPEGKCPHWRDTRDVNFRIMRRQMRFQRAARKAARLAQ